MIESIAATIECLNNNYLLIRQSNPDGFGDRMIKQVLVEDMGLWIKQLKD